MALKTTQPKTRWPLIGGMLAVALVAVGGFYWMVLRVPAQPQQAVASQGPSFVTTFKTKVLDDVRIKSLRQHGQPEVQVQERGLKPNPFQPF